VDIFSLQLIISNLILLQKMLLRCTKQQKNMEDISEMSSYEDSFQNPKDNSFIKRGFVFLRRPIERRINYFTGRQEDKNEGK